MAGTKDKGKVKIEPANPPRRGIWKCFDYLFPTLLAVVVMSYGGFLYNPDQARALARSYNALQPIVTFFDFVDEYSPFHEFINDLDTKQAASATEKKEPAKESEKPNTGARIMTKDELAAYDGTDDSKGIYLAILGQVFDVSKGKDYYAKGGGYGFFSGIDGSRAFVTGQFDEAGLIDDVSGLTGQDYLGLQEWTEFYHKDYIYIGKLVGNFYDENGNEKAAMKEFQANVAEAKKDVEKKNAEKIMFPPCNSEWSKKKGHRVWCTTKTGGQDRGWVGRPRKLFYPGRKERCACVKDFGPPSTDPGAKTDIGDLDSPHLKEYDNCDPSADSCMIKPPEEIDD